MSYFCYIVQCADSSYYTGWTTDPIRRTKQHNNGTGAKYTRMHGPVNAGLHRRTTRQSGSHEARTHHKKHAAVKKSSLDPGQPNYRKILSMSESKFQFLAIAPGRVNILGEHVDYNGGPVMPAAIDLNVKLEFSPRNDSLVNLESIDFGVQCYFQSHAVGSKVGY